VVIRIRDVLSAAQAGRLAEALVEDRSVRDARPLLIRALRSHPLFEFAAHPRAFARPTVSRMEAGMQRIERVEDAILSRSNPMRTDLVATIFLSDPAEYGGGDLAIDTGYGIERYRENLGACLIYPAAARSAVEPVTRGTRLTVDFAVQSLIRDPARREILYDIGCAAEYRSICERSDSVTLRRCYQDLLRLWAEP
jgi:PKHD-type hydroxylase